MLQSKISRIMEDFIIYSCSHPTDSQSSASYVRYLCRNDKLISTCSSSHMQQAPNSSKSKFISVTFHFRCYRPHIYKFALAVSLVSVFSFGYPNYSAYNGISHTHTHRHTRNGVPQVSLSFHSKRDIMWVSRWQVPANIWNFRENITWM